MTGTGVGLGCTDVAVGTLITDGAVGATAGCSVLPLQVVAAHRARPCPREALVQREISVGGAPAQQARPCPVRLPVMPW